MAHHSMMVHHPQHSTSQAWRQAKKAVSHVADGRSKKMINRWENWLFCCASNFLCLHPGQCIAVFIQCVAAVSGDKLHAQAMFVGQRPHLLYQVTISSGFAAVQNRGHILAVCDHRHLAAAFEGGQTGNDRLQLHAIIGDMCLAARERLFMGSALQNCSIPSRARVVEA